MKKKIIFFALTTFIMSSFYACKKKDDPAPSNNAAQTGTGCTLSSFSNKEGSIQVYSRNGLIDSITSRSFLFSNEKFYYDGNKRLIKIETSDNSYTTYTYNSSGQCIADSNFKFTDDENKFIVFKVNKYTCSGNLISKIDNYYEMGDMEFHSTISETYDSNGNLKESKEYMQGQLLRTTTYTYDDKRYGLKGIYMDMFNDLVSVNQQHNITSKTVVSEDSQDDAANSYTSSFTYDSQGNPLTEKRVHKDGTVDNIAYNYQCR